MVEQSNQLEINYDDLSSLQPPLEAYLYFPKLEDQYKGKEKKILRWIFEGDVVYDQFEYLKLTRLMTFLAEKKCSDIIKGWTEPQILRWLEGNQFERKKTKESIQEHNLWREKMPIKLDDDVKEYINSGIIYLCGRDHRFRPIIVMDMGKIDTKKYNQDFLLKGMDYFLGQIMKEMYLPGQIENWNFIMDFNKEGITDLPLNAFKKIVQYLASNYKSRLHRLYCVNVPGSITVPWSAVKIFLEDDTVVKISFIKSNVPTDLYTHANPYQVEQKFGGKQPDRVYPFWPPKLPKDNFFLETENPADILVTPQTYKKMVREGKLRKSIINDEIVHGKVPQIPQIPIQVNQVEKQIEENKTNQDQIQN